MRDYGSAMTQRILHARRDKKYQSATLQSGYLIG
jgi:hypothetical protein